MVAGQLGRNDNRDGAPQRRLGQPRLATHTARPTLHGRSGGRRAAHGAFEMLAAPFSITAGEAALMRA
jgi:hypothetical protein